MSKRIELSRSFLYTLAHSSAKRRKLLLSNATKAELNALFEICLNVIRGNLPLDPTTFKKFRRERKVIETLSNRSVPLKTKQKIVNQKGGFIGKLALFALPLLADVASKLLKK